MAAAIATVVVAAAAEEDRRYRHLQDLEFELDESHKQQKHLQSELDEAHKKETHLKSKLKKVDEDWNTEKRCVHVMRISLENKQKEHEALQTQLLKAEQDLKNLRAELKKAQKTINQISASYELTKQKDDAQIRTNQKEIEQLQGAVNWYERKKNELAENINHLQTGLKKQRQENNELRKSHQHDIALYELQEQADLAENRTKTEQIRKLQKKITSLENQHKQDLSGVDGHWTRLHQVCDNVRTELESDFKKLQTTKQTLNEYKQKNEYGDDTLPKNLEPGLELVITNLETRLDEMLRGIDKVENQLQEHQFASEEFSGVSDFDLEEESDLEKSDNSEVDSEKSDDSIWMLNHMDVEKEYNDPKNRWNALANDSNLSDNPFIV